jgi:hypothetical protein
MNTKNAGNNALKAGGNNKNALANKATNLGNNKNALANKATNLGNKANNLGNNKGASANNKLNNAKSNSNNSKSNSNSNANANTNANSNNVDNSSMVKDIVITVVVLIVVGVVIYFLTRMLKQFLLGKNDQPWIIQNSKNAKNSLVITQDPKNENSVTLYRSDNQAAGAEFTYSFWFVIENLEYKYGEWKHMFHKGNKTSYPNRAPGVFIHPTKNAVRIYMNTLNNILEYVEIDNIPIKRWVHMSIILNGTFLDIYVNGYLRKRHELSGVVKQNFGDLWLNLFGGFEGYMCRMRYYRRALEYNEVESIVRNGPSNEACGDTGEKPPYLDDNWWFDF